MKQARVLSAMLVTLLALWTSSIRAQEPPPAPPGQGTPPAAAPQGQHRTLPKPVNLQILPKDIATDELIKIMRGYSQQLGVHCEFCHEEDAATKRPNFASDAKPEKNIARTMMRMTGNINAEYLAKITVPDAKPAEREVTCGTCHRGVPIPTVFQAPNAPGKPPQPAGQAPPAPGPSAPTR